MEQHLVRTILAAMASIGKVEYRIKDELISFYRISECIIGNFYFLKVIFSMTGSIKLCFFIYLLIATLVQRYSLAIAYL